MINYTKESVNYGVHFMEPVDEVRDGAPNYYQYIKEPMDFGTIQNRLYLNIYKTIPEFWADLGLVFKNCRYYNADDSCEIRILSDSLREISIQLYKQWHKHATSRYEQLLTLLKNKQLSPDFDGKMSSEVEEIKKSIQEEIEKKQVELFRVLREYDEMMLPEGTVDPSLGLSPEKLEQLRAKKKLEMFINQNK